jgi:hypothetical protein
MFDAIAKYDEFPSLVIADINMPVFSISDTDQTIDNSASRFRL